MMNIRSRPKYHGELFYLLFVSETRFNVITLTENGAFNISTVQSIMDDCPFYHVISENNVYGVVGVYVHDSFLDVSVMDD